MPIPPAPVPPVVWIQPIVRDRQGVLRFRANPLVRYLLDCGSLHLVELNLVAAGCAPNPEECARWQMRPEMIEQAQRAKAGLAETTVEDWEQLHQLTVADPNPIITYLLDRGGVGIRGLVAATSGGAVHSWRITNDRLGIQDAPITEATDDDWDMFLMVIGYSVSGLPYKNEGTYRHCQELARRMTATVTAAEQPGGA
jgi:hypothetical protein